MFFWKMMSLALASKFLFFPAPIIEYSPSQLKIPYQDIHFKSDEGHSLHAWFFPGKKNNHTLFYLHGNAGNIGDRLDKIQFLRRLGWNIFIFDYQGFGDSEGKPSVEGVLRDSEAAFRYLTQQLKIPNQQIILFGESLGGAMAVHLAHQENVEAVVLESTFTALREMASRVYPFVPRFLVPDVYRSVDLIKEIKVPLLVIHGQEDEVVPFALGKKLFEAAPQTKKFYAVPKAHHNDVYIVGKLEYLKQLQDFLSMIEMN